MGKLIKKRLDQLMVENGMTETLREASALIMAGKVLVERVPVDKPGTLIASGSDISIKTSETDYVSRGALKLEKALTALGMNIENQICLDVGASTGGFTDCLLRHGAKKVYSVDVAYGQLAWKLRQDKRVVVIERTNIRKMPPEAIEDPIDLVVIDTSFISLRLVIPAVIKYMKKGAGILALIKPQFEVEKGDVGLGGVVKDPILHKKTVSDLSDFFLSELALQTEAVIESPILGPKGNKEFIIFLK